MLIDLAVAKMLLSSELNKEISWNHVIQGVVAYQPEIKAGVES